MSVEFRSGHAHSTVSRCGDRAQVAVAIGSQCLSAMSLDDVREVMAALRLALSEAEKLQRVMDSRGGRGVL